MTTARPTPISVRELVDQAAEECAETTFLIDPLYDRPLTFGDLQARARAVVRGVQDRRLSPGARVGVVMDNGLAAAVTHLGLMYGGYACVPMNPSAAEQIAYVAEHSEVDLIFASRDYAAAVKTALVDARQLDVVTLDVGDIEPLPEANALLAELGGDDDAMLMYTSGTTSRPKGVVVSQRAMVARGIHDALSQELSADDRLLCVLPLYHMNAVCALFGVLCSRGSMVLPCRFALAEYWDLAIRYRCTRLSGVPTILSQLVAWSQVDRTALGGIRHMRSSSAPLTPALHRAFEERFGLLVIEGMGMTETGGIFMNPPSRERRKIGSLGVACSSEVRIVGADGSELPPGEVGRILVRGPGLMARYHKDPESTRNAVDTEGWFHSGDLGSLDDEGYFFHRGREKEIIIKAGTNISPLAIDEVLLSHRKVAEAAAVGIPDPHLGEDIAAFVVLKDGAKLGDDNLVSYCEERVGAFRAPSTVVVVNSLPRGPTGKVLRHELAARLPARSDAWREAAPRSTASGGPRTVLETEVASVWSEVLRCEQFGTSANFFALGGNSMLALQVLARLRERLDTRLSLSAFFEAPTVAEQAAIIEQERSRSESEVSEESKAILLVPVRSGCAATPLFGAYGLTRYRSLAECLGAEQPVYGLVVEREGDIVLGAGAPFGVAELARQYLIAVRRVQPKGPYQFVGFSFGGRVALEMARQLRAVGETVALVVAVDTFMPGAVRRRPLPWLMFHLRKAVEQGPRHVLDSIRRRWGYEVLRAGNESARMREHEAAYRARSRARHSPQPYDGKIVLVRARDNDFPEYYTVDPLLGWGSLARGELVVEDVPGRHADLPKTPAINEIAERLRSHLLGEGSGESETRRPMGHESDSRATEERRSIASPDARTN